MRSKVPEFYYEPTLSKLDGTLIRGLLQPELYDHVLCPPQTTILCFGQKGTRYNKHCEQRIIEAELGCTRIVIGKHNIDHLQDIIEDAISQVFYPATTPHVLILENFEHVVLGAMQYRDTADYCSRLTDIKASLSNPETGIAHGILCLSNVAPTPTQHAVVNTMWQQFDVQLGYCVMSQEQRKQLFEWYFGAFTQHCSNVARLNARVKIPWKTTTLTTIWTT